MMETRNCPFCAIEKSRILAQNDLVVAFFDGFPVNPGHTLIIPRRHVAVYFDLTDAEKTNSKLREFNSEFVDGAWKKRPHRVAVETSGVNIAKAFKYPVVYSDEYLIVATTRPETMFGDVCVCVNPKDKKFLKYHGKKVINQLIVYSLMFSSAVTAIPSYLIISNLGLLDTQWSIIVPSWGFTLGLFLMRQFMVNIPDDLLEAAKIDGAGEFQIFFKVVMPIVKPAWLTLIILLFSGRKNLAPAHSGIPFEKGMR